MTGMDVRVRAAQAEQELSPAAAVGGRPGAGGLVRAVRGRGLLVGGTGLGGQVPAEDSRPRLFQGLVGTVFEDLPRGTWTCGIGRT